MAKNTCKRTSLKKIREELLAVLRSAYRPLYASEVAQKVFERTRDGERSMCLSDAAARKELRALAEAGEVIEHTKVAYVPAARGRRPLSTYSAKS